jgi:hypothetical protein
MCGWKGVLSLYIKEHSSCDERKKKVSEAVKEYEETETRDPGD